MPQRTVKISIWQRLHVCRHAIVYTFSSALKVLSPHFVAISTTRCVRMKVEAAMQLRADGNIPLHSQLITITDITPVQCMVAMCASENITFLTL